MGLPNNSKNKGVEGTFYNNPGLKGIKRLRTYRKHDKIKV